MRGLKLLHAQPCCCRGARDVVLALAHVFRGSICHGCANCIRCVPFRGRCRLFRQSSSVVAAKGGERQIETDTKKESNASDSSLFFFLEKRKGWKKHKLATLPCVHCTRSMTAIALAWLLVLTCCLTCGNFAPLSVARTQHSFLFTLQNRISWHFMH